MQAAATLPNIREMPDIPALSALRRWVEERDFAGYDPYDGLNSPVLRNSEPRGCCRRALCEEFVDEGTASPGEDISGKS